MKRLKVNILPGAYTNLKEARAYTANKTLRCLSALCSRLKQLLRALRPLPATHAIRYRNVRMAHIAIFSYAIHYLVENDCIVILAVHHTATDPAKWKERL